MSLQLCFCTIKKAENGARIRRSVIGQLFLLSALHFLQLVLRISCYIKQFPLYGILIRSHRLFPWQCLDIYIYKLIVGHLWELKGEIYEYSDRFKVGVFLETYLLFTCHFRFTLVNNYFNNLAFIPEILKFFNLSQRVLFLLQTSFLFNL